MIERTTWRGVNAIALAYEGLRATLLPSLGGKLVSIVDEDDRELLFQREDRDYLVPEYGTGFDEWDCSGWDECFPTIAACTIAEGPWAGVPVPCHGELWCVPAEVSTSDDVVTLETRGVRFPYRFQRRVSLPGPGRLRIDYTVTNEAPFDLPYVYSAHPLFQVSDHTVVVLPDEVSQVRVDNTRHGRLGGLGDTLAWPKTPLPDGGHTDLSRLTGPEQNSGDKLYTQRLQQAGWCGFVDRRRELTVGFRFDRALLGRVGIWENQGALLGHFNLALEPCTSYPDRLDLAMARGEALVLAAGGQESWWIELVTGSGDEERLKELVRA